MHYSLYIFTPTVRPPEFIFLPSFSLWPAPSHLVVLPTYSLSNSLSCHFKQNQHVLGAGLWRGNCQSIRIQIINVLLFFFLHHKCHLLGAYLSASPPHLRLS